MKYKSNENYNHGDKRNIGVLLVNLGTPDAPTTRDVRKYLKEFLSDPRIVEIPKIIWWLILNLIILNIRPRKSKKLYEKIWLEDGSPLLVNSKKIIEKIKMSEDSYQKNLIIDLAMRYGNPSIKKALENFKKKNVNKISVIPMFPQYSAATTASIFDKISAELTTWRNLPDIRFLSSYHDDKNYIDACVNRIKTYWEKKGKSNQLIFSFHGLPQINLFKGDPYHCYCQKTARLIAEKLNISKNEYSVTFQSRFGTQKWLQPYTDDIIENLAKSRVESIDVFCPGFLCDCLETLEEINMQSRELFFSSGGKSFNYIPALNDSDYNIKAMTEIIKNELNGWDNNNINLEKNRQETKRLYEESTDNKII